MRKLTITTATITALTALTALTTITATIATAALPEFNKTKIKFTSLSGPGTLDVAGGNTIECESATDAGEISGPKTVTLQVDVRTCKIFGLIGSHSLGDPENTILIAATGTLCYLNKAKKEVGLVLTPTGLLHIEAPVAAALALIKGTLIGRLTPVNTTTLRGELILTQSEGKQGLLACEELAGETHLSTSENEGEYKASGLGTTDTIGFLVSEVDLLA
jgi:hypothetical protein